MTAAVWVLALGGVAILLALLWLSSPSLRPQVRTSSTRAEAARAWPAGDGAAARGRVLVVERASRDSESDVALLRAGGYDVRSCSGPEASLERFPYGGCLLLNEEQCPLAHGTDAIVFGLPLDALAHRSVLRGYRAKYPTTPIFVRTSDRESEWFANLLRDCRVARRGPEDELLGLVETSLSGEGVVEA